MVEYRGEKFSGYNKPKRTPKHKTKSHAVLAKEGKTIKLIRFGQQGVSGAGKNPGRFLAGKTNLRILNLPRIRPGRSRTTLDIMHKVSLRLSYQLNIGVTK